MISTIWSKMQFIVYLVALLLRGSCHNVSEIINKSSLEDHSELESNVTVEGTSDNGDLNSRLSQGNNATAERNLSKSFDSNDVQTDGHGEIELRMSTVISHNHLINDSKSVDSDWRNKVTIVCLFKKDLNGSITFFGEQLSNVVNRYFSAAGFHRRMKNICEEIQREKAIFSGHYKDVIAEKLRAYYERDVEEMQYLTSIFYDTFPFSGCLANPMCRVYFEREHDNIDTSGTPNASRTPLQSTPKRLNKDTFIFCYGEERLDSPPSVKQLNLEQIHSMYRQYFDDVYYIRSIGILLFISAFFMFVTTVIYCLLPELRFNVYGKCVIFYLGTTSVAYTCFGSRLTFPGQLSSFCEFTGFMFQFSWIASFTWQSVMCFDILLALSVLRWKVTEGRRDQVKKMTVYSLYAFGLPALITITTIVFQYTSVLPHDSRWKPNVGGRFCFFQHADGEGRKLRWLYFCGPYSVVIVTNFIMFVATGIFIRKHSKTASKLNGSNSRRCSNRNRDNEMFQVHLTLFFVMGTNWLLEVVSLVKDNAGLTSGWLFRAVDYFHVSIGMVLFMVLVCKDKVVSGLRNKLVAKPTTKHKSINSVTTDNISLPSVVVDPSTSCETNLSSAGLD